MQQPAQYHRTCAHDDIIHVDVEIDECNACGSKLIAGWVHAPDGTTYRLQEAVTHG